MPTATIERVSAGRVAPSLGMALYETATNIAAAFFDSYRPELHYMRGPGPKWRAKHAPAKNADVEIGVLFPAHHAPA